VANAYEPVRATDFFAPDPALILHRPDSAHMAVKSVQCMAEQPGMPEPFGPGKVVGPRRIAGLPHLQHTFDLPEEEGVWRWVENPYWQVFTGKTCLQTGSPSKSVS
jgi:hypothetical protein